VAKLVREAPCPVDTFGLAEGADWRAVDVRTTAGGSAFRVLRRGADVGTFASPLAGDHNVRNALAALATCAAAGVEPQRLREALAAFRGVKRRLELRGRARGVSVYDDFAHHPTAVKATLEALRASGTGGRLIAVFEPRSYTSRTRVFLDDFASALAGADLSIVAAAHLPGKVPEGQRLSEGELVDAVRARGGRAEFWPGVPEIVARLASEAREGDVIAVLSNGGFGGIHEKLLQALATP
jgi:UDP-N-acetylmuramate: L-alanyl-gamma-D-glutamyl-meso-diaminopimelate ligase